MTYLDGFEWMERFTEAYGALQGNLLFPTFGLGQLGAIGRSDPERARAMIEALRIDAGDIESSAAHLAAVMRAILTNAETQLNDAAR